MASLPASAMKVSPGDVRLIGYASLRRRLAAIKGPILGRDIMASLGRQTVLEAGLLAPKKTGHLRGSIHLGPVTETSAQVFASANYAAYVEFGTKAHEITPNARKALRWTASSSGRRLTGTPTKAAQRGQAGGVVFATRVHHPGTRAHPYLLPGAKAALKGAGVLDRVVAAWNEAA